MRGVLQFAGNKLKVKHTFGSNESPNHCALISISFNRKIFNNLEFCKIRKNVISSEARNLVNYLI